MILQCSFIQIECWKANLLVLIKIIPIKINQKFENILPIDNNLAIENVESIIHCEYIHRVWRPGNSRSREFFIFLRVSEPESKKIGTGKSLRAGLKKIYPQQNDVRWKISNCPGHLVAEAFKGWANFLGDRNIEQTTGYVAMCGLL